MPTANLGLTTINGSDFVNAQVLTENFELIDKLAYDYIVDQGKSGQWRYRKYKSGMAECWGKITFSPTTTVGQVQCGITFPFVFSEEPTVSVCGGVDYRNDSHISYVNTHGQGTGIDCYLVKNTSENYAYWVYVYAIGMTS